MDVAQEGFRGFAERAHLVVGLDVELDLLAGESVDPGENFSGLCGAYCAR